MATVTKPIALDESFHTTDGNNTNIADVLAELIDVISSNVITTTQSFNGGEISALGHNASVLSLTVPTGYSLKSYMIETTGAYGTYINFFVSNGVLNATNCHPSHSATCTGKITCIWQK